MFAVAWIRVCPERGSESSPERPIVTVEGSSPVRVTASTFSTLDQALAEALSSGVPAVPTRGSEGSTQSTTAPPVSRAR
nr:hypothetical protein GCM10025699_53570 [Microbacterium flavescens]